MSAHSPVLPEPLIGSEASRLLDELGETYAFVIASDDQAHVLWVSPPWRSLCAGRAELSSREAVARLLRRERSFALASRYREQGYLLHEDVEVIHPERGALAFELSAFALPGTPADGKRAAIVLRPARPAEPAERPALLEQSATALLHVGRDGFVRYASPAFAQLTGLSREHLEGAPLAALVVGGDALSAALEALRNPGAREIGGALLCATGDALPVTLSIRASRAASGAGDGILVVAHDRSAALAREADLERRNGELEHCVNTLAHDLRSPLVALLGFSRLLRQDYGDRIDETGAHFIDRIEQAGRTMEALIHDLLELSRIGQAGERPALVDPRSVLAQIAAELKPRLDAGHVRLDLPDDAPLVFCDRTRLYQVFSNLIGNAIDHMGDCDVRRIAVDISEQENEHRISVRDWGCGIDPEQHERIFEAFHSLGPRRAGRQGTGMGLAIVRRIAESRGGRAWVESRPGEGAEFHVTLPRR